MASKKKWRKRALEQAQIADDLFEQVRVLSGQLHKVDEVLVNAELPGPTIDAWAAQVRQVLSSLVQERGIVSGGIAQAYTLQPVRPPSGVSIRDPEAPDNGEYELLTDKDLKPFSQEQVDVITGRGMSGEVLAPDTNHGGNRIPGRYA